MKLTYHIEQVTTLEPKAVIERLTAELESKKYGIVSTRDKEIIFTDAPSFLKWRHEPSQIDEGVFTLDTERNETTVKLTYSISYLPLLISVLFFLGLSVLEDPEILYLVALLLLGGLFEYFNLKFKASSLIRVCKS